MKKQIIHNAIYFLRRVVVHGSDQDLLFETVEALNKELEPKPHKPAQDEPLAAKTPIKPKDTK